MSAPLGSLHDPINLMLLAVLFISGLLLQAGASPNLQRGVKLYEEGKTRDAIEPLRQELKANPASARAQGYLGLSMAEAGFCPDGVPLLKKSLPKIDVKEMRRAMAMDGVRCAMSLNHQDEALEFLRSLRLDFPKDPEVLYLATHVYSDLSMRASQELIFSAPGSYQVHQLNAEALETQGKWEEAAAEYRLVLAANPTLSGIHFRLARLILSAPKTATTFTEATREIEAELRINPANPGAEYVLGEIARQTDNWPDAIEHFSRAATLDPNFADAYIGLGRALIQQDKPAEAIQPLQMATRLEPDNPTAHYHLAVAYRRAGRLGEADKESQSYREVSAKADAMRHRVESGVLGPQGIDAREQR